MDKPLPCPFCGWPASHDTSSGTGVAYVLCSDCGAEGPVADTAEEAMAAWNTRQPATAAGE